MSKKINVTVPTFPRTTNVVKHAVDNKVTRTVAAPPLTAIQFVEQKGGRAVTAIKDKKTSMRTKREVKKAQKAAVKVNIAVAKEFQKLLEETNGDLMAAAQVMNTRQD